MSLLGKKAPDFSLFDHNKQETSLSSFRGKKVILAFYPAAFTGVCKKELCTFEESLAELGQMNSAILGVSVDGPFANAAFAEANNLNFPLLSDYERSTVNAYGIALPDFAGMPGYTASQRAVFVIDESGDVIYEWVGEHPGLEPDYEAVKGAL